jgi:hypothetical protein
MISSQPEPLIHYPKSQTDGSGHTQPWEDQAVSRTLLLPSGIRWRTIDFGTTNSLFRCLILSHSAPYRSEL